MADIDIPFDDIQDLTGQRSSGTKSSGQNFIAIILTVIVGAIIFVIFLALFNAFQKWYDERNKGVDEVTKNVNFAIIAIIISIILLIIIYFIWKATQN